MIIYIRHAESIGNLLNSATGDQVQELSFSGREHCKSVSILTRKLSNIRIICSTAARAMETASLLFGSLEIELTDQVLETDGGPMSRIEERYLYSYFNLPNDEDRIYKGGESNSEMKNRVIAFHRNLQTEYKKGVTTFIVCHSGPIISIARELNQPLDQVDHLGGIALVPSENKSNEYIYHYFSTLDALYNEVSCDYY